jgi:predicted transcriptional regulator of viral defense system
MLLCNDMNGEQPGIAGPDHELLFAIASGQAGYFTAQQAHEAGFTARLLQHHADQGRFRRIHRGVYRLRDYPSSPLDQVIAAVMTVGSSAVVSHSSALDLLGLSDVIPDAIHLTVPRTKRHSPCLPGVIVHTTTRLLGGSDVVVRDGIRVTSPTRTILDAAEAGVGPEQVVAAIREAEQRGLLTFRQLLHSVRTRPSRVQRLIKVAVEGTG